MIVKRNVFRQLDDSIYNEKSQQPRQFKNERYHVIFFGVLDKLKQNVGKSN